MKLAFPKSRMAMILPAIEQSSPTMPTPRPKENRRPDEFPETCASHGNCWERVDAFPSEFLQIPYSLLDQLTGLFHFVFPNF